MYIPKKVRRYNGLIQSRLEGLGVSDAVKNAITRSCSICLEDFVNNIDSTPCGCRVCHQRYYIHWNVRQCVSVIHYNKAAYNGPLCPNGCVARREEYAAGD